MQPISKYAKDALGKPCEREDLAAVGMAGELKAESGCFNKRQTGGHMVEQNSCLAALDLIASSAERRREGSE